MAERKNTPEPGELLYSPRPSWAPPFLALGAVGLVCGIFAAGFIFSPIVYAILGAIIVLFAFRALVAEAVSGYYRLPRRQRVHGAVLPVQPVLWPPQTVRSESLPDHSPVLCAGYTRGMSSEPSDIRELVERISPEQIAAAQAPLEAILDAQRMRIEYSETRRAALGVLGGVVLAAGLAGLIQVASADISYTPARAGLVALTASLALTGVLVLVLYGRQTTWPYPFKDKLASTWKWFYRDAVPEAADVEPRLDSRQSKDFRRRSKDAFAGSRVPYVERMLSLADAKINLTQDLEQAHLLNWNEFYKNRFLGHLRIVLIRGVVGSVFLGVASFVVAIALGHCS